MPLISPYLNALIPIRQMRTYSIALRGTYLAMINFTLEVVYMLIFHMSCIFKSQFDGLVHLGI